MALARALDAGGRSLVAPTQTPAESLRCRVRQGKHGIAEERHAVAVYFQKSHLSTTNVLPTDLSWPIPAIHENLMKIIQQGQMVK